jgi:predicted nucleic acid-binding protein
VSFLLDTNVISEGAKPRPDRGVMEWLATISEKQLFLSVVSLAELRHGVERMGKGKRRVAPDLGLTADLPRRFGDRLLAIDATTADLWGRTVARAQAAGRPIGAMNAFLAATAEQYQLVLVTRNISDFEVIGTQLFNPWHKPTSR